MQYIKFGNTGMDVSRICLGMMSFGKPGKENGVFPWAKDYEDAKPLFKKAIDLGINYFDTANVYQMGTSEEITGRLSPTAAAHPARTSWPRSTIRSSASTWTTWTSTRSTALTRARRWRRDEVRLAPAAVQPHLPRGGARDPSALPRPQDGRRSVESARRRPLRPSVGDEDRAQRDRRSVTDGMGCDGRARQSGCGQP